MDTAFLTGLGLAAPAGLNAYLPLLIVALADRFTGLIELDRPYHFLSSLAGIGILILLLTVELVVDKIPGLDHANDLIQSAIRPAAGAGLMMAATSDWPALNPVLALLIGLVAAGVVHTAKATTRPLITVGTGGMGNPLVSLVEDGIAGVTAVVALVLPLGVLVLLLVFAGFLVWSTRRVRRRFGSALPPAPGRAGPGLHS